MKVKRVEKNVLLCVGDSLKVMSKFLCFSITLYMGLFCKDKSVCKCFFP